MKLKEFTENLNKILNENPEYADLEVITATDDEGNGYNGVYYSPIVGDWTEDDEFIARRNKEDFDAHGYEIKVICVN